jgi:hypothetical protein
VGEVTFGDVRAIMSRAPALAWRQLALAADGYHDMREWREVVVPYVKGQAEQWPRAVERRAPIGWVSRLLDGGGEHPMLRLCGVVEVPGRMIDASALDVLGEAGVWSVRRLEVEGDVSERTWGAWARREDVDVEELCLRGGTNTALALGQLVKGGWFGRVRRFEADGGNVGVRGVRALASQDALGLEALAFDACGVGEGSLDALREAAWLAGLSALELTDRQARKTRGAGRRFDGALRVRDGELERFFAEGVVALRRLSMEGVGLGGRAAVLARALGPRLDVAVFSRCALGDEDVEAMVSRGVFERARRVDLSQNAFGPRGLDALSRQQMPALERLRVWPSARLGRARAEAFADSPVWGEEVRDEMWADLEGEGEPWGT